MDDIETEQEAFERVFNDAIAEPIRPSYGPLPSRRDDIAIELQNLQHVFSYPSADPIQLSYGLLKSVTDNFSYEIGRGGFGVVYMGHLKNGNVAVKQFSNLHVLPDKQFLDETTCLKKAKHENIVRLLGYCSETHGELHEVNGRAVMAEIPQKLLCFEYVPNGNIRHYLEHEKPHGDNWPTRYQMIRGICYGLHYLHDKQINHLDLKPENVMLDAEMEPKITDFGLSRLLDEGQSKMFTQHIVGTLRYIAPEIIDKGEISFKSDIYALGIIIIELLTGISRKSLENWDESLDGESPRVRRCTEIARKCTDANRYNRPTACEIISDLDELESMTPQSSKNQNHEYSFLVEPRDAGPVGIKKRTGRVPEVQSWVSFLANLQELHLELQRVGQGELCVLGGLPALLILNLKVTAKFKDRLRVSGAVGFPCLRELHYHGVQFGGMDLMFAPGSMPKLEKLDIVFIAGESDSLSSNAFDIGIGNLRSLISVKWEVRVLVEPRDAGPVGIEKRTGGVPEVQSWMSFLPNLQKLHLELESVGQGELYVLGGLPALLILNLKVTAKAKDRLRVSGAVGFRCLRELLYHRVLFGGMDMMFAPGSMPKLEKLDIEFNAGESDSLRSDAFDIGIGNLPSLISVKCEVRGWLDSAVLAAKAYLKRTARTHPNRPTLLLA